jgi:serine/threonine protein kinase
LPSNCWQSPRARTAGRRARFIQEAKAASALNHPNIVTIHEIAEQDGHTFIVMELVEGKPLNEIIPRKRMRLTEALAISDALATAHAAGIVHRDLKPGNIMVDAHGRVKVLDFGLAKLIAPAASSPSADDQETRTMTMDQPLTEEGSIVGSVPGSGANADWGDSYTLKSCSKAGLRSSDRGVVRSLVPQLQIELSGSGGHDGRAWHCPGAHDDSALGAALYP